jgi:hypothetical protein
MSSVCAERGDSSSGCGGGAAVAAAQSCSVASSARAALTTTDSPATSSGATCSAARTLCQCDWHWTAPFLPRVHMQCVRMARTALPA